MSAWVRAVRGIRSMFVRDSPAHLSVVCERCNEIRYAPWRDLILFWDPRREPTEADGEAIRSMALVEHVAAGHPRG